LKTNHLATLVGKTNRQREFLQKLEDCAAVWRISNTAEKMFFMGQKKYLKKRRFEFGKIYCRLDNVYVRV
jgi:hypothetical protein